jgi:hypothetical protein
MLSKKIRIIFLVLFLISIISINSSIGTIAILSPSSINEVTIDGKWTASDEWDDAVEFPIKFGFTHYIFGYFLIKDTEEFLYVMIDHTPDVTLEDGDSGRIRLDIDNDGYNSPKKDDYIISIEWNGNNTGISVQQGNGVEWIMTTNIPEGIEGASTKNAENNPYSKNQHLMYEFAIPRNIIGNEPVIGFSAMAVDPSVERARALERSETTRPRYISFPDGAHYLKPSTWAKLQFSTIFKEKSKSESTSNPSQNSIPTPTPAPNPGPTQKPTPKPITKPEPSPTTNPGGSQEVLFVSKLPGGYPTFASILIIVIIILAAFFFTRRKK